MFLKKEHVRRKKTAFWMGVEIAVVFQPNQADYAKPDAGWTKRCKSLAKRG